MELRWVAFSCFNFFRQRLSNNTFKSKKPWQCALLLWVIATILNNLQLRPFLFWKKEIPWEWGGILKLSEVHSLCLKSGCETFVSQSSFFAKSTPNQRRYLHGSTTFFGHESTEPCFFDVDGRLFFAGCFTSCRFSLWCPFFREEHYESRSFSSSFNDFFWRRAYRAVFFPRVWKAFSHRMHFELSFSVLINDRFFARSMSSHRLFSAKAVFFFIGQRTFPSGFISL